MLVDVEPYAYAALAGVLHHAGHVELVHHLGGVAVVAGAGQVPQPVEEHVWYVVFGAEIKSADSSLGADSGLAHDGAWLHPLFRVGYPAGRVEVEDDIVVFKQLSGRVGRHYHFPRSGVIGDDVDRRIHHGAECAVAARVEAREAPVVDVGVGQRAPVAAGVFNRQCALHGVRERVGAHAHEGCLRPLLGPEHRALGQAVGGEVVGDFMEHGGGMLREEVAEGHAFVVGADFYVEAVLRGVVAREVQCAAVPAVAHRGALSVEGMPRGVGLLISDAVETHQVHPAFGLREAALAQRQRHLPRPVVEVESHSAARDDGTAAERDVVAHRSHRVGVHRMLYVDALRAVGRYERQRRQR